MQGEQFAVEELEVVAATVDLDEVVSWRGKNSSQREQASAAPRYLGFRVFHNTVLPLLHSICRAADQRCPGFNYPVTVQSRVVDLF